MNNINNDKKYDDIIDGKKRYEIANFNLNKEKINNQLRCEKQAISIINNKNNLPFPYSQVEIRDCEYNDFSHNFLVYISNNGYKITKNYLGAVIKYSDD